MSENYRNYRINSENVMHETIDGEVVIINLDRGTYYSLDGVGACVWAYLEQGASVDGLVDRVATRYEGERDRMARSVGAFLERLHAEDLVATAQANGAGDGPVDPPGAERRAFLEPTLQKYTDMEQLLLVDPIHEVEESGWPNVK